MAIDEGGSEVAVHDTVAFANVATLVVLPAPIPLVFLFGSLLFSAGFIQEAPGATLWRT